MVPALEPTCWHLYPQDVKILNGKGEGFLKFVESSNTNKKSSYIKTLDKKMPFSKDNESSNLHIPRLLPNMTKSADSLPVFKHDLNFS